ncbi:MAG: TetR family transcriptional regulator [Clostridia bacterium]|jgi:AcrR family transcriptional regulator|nr:TetR family transcriptional regulator [Clostridia bacterium]
MFEKELTKRQIQAQNTKNLIYKTAVEMMEQKGFENLKVEEICRAAGVSVGSFYNCFKSKYEILNEVFKHLDDYILEVAPYTLAEGSAVERIVNFFEIYANYNVNRGIGFVKQLYGVHNNLFITKGRHLQTTLAKIIEEGQNSGELSQELTPDEAVEYLFVAVRGAVYNWCLHEGEFDLVSYVSGFVKKLARAIVKQQG